MNIDKYKKPDGSYEDPEGCYHEDAESFLQTYVLGFCGCGCPEESLGHIRDVLQHIDNLKQLVWEKKQTITEDFTMSMCEIASLSEGLSTVSKWIEMRPQDPQRIHPTQKPVALYRWLLDRYSKPNQRILDTHLGSGSHAIAAHYFGAHLTGCDNDPDYFREATARIKRETAQATLF